MKIYLAEETKRQLQPEREFDSASVRVGRDGGECQIVFDGNEWPMVSRNIGQAPAGAQDVRLFPQRSELAWCGVTIHRIE
jgi:hypothetical protein